jgi:hypothetical protein
MCLILVTHFGVVYRNRVCHKEVSFKASLTECVAEICGLPTLHVAVPIFRSSWREC